MAGETEFGLLGPLVVRRGGALVPVSAGRQAAGVASGSAAAREPAGPAGFTAPGDHAGALARLPADLAALTEVAHGLIMHEHMAGMYGFELAGERRASVHIRPVSRLLDQIVAGDGRPLEVAREPSARLPGNCRHFTVLTVAVLRAHGIPARARCGFGGYFGTGW